jgi:hypothetical protein
MSPMLPAMFAFVPFFIIMVFWAMQRPKACPDCGESLSFFLSPLKKTKRIWVEGGNICPKCGCEVDTAGRKVLAGTPPRLRSIVTGIVMLTLAVIPGAILLSLILQR